MTRWLGVERLILGFALACSLVCSPEPVNADTIRVGIDADDDEMFQARRDAFEEGRCPTIESYDGRTASRVDIELTILCTALSRGGSNNRIEFVRQPNYVRTLAETVSGRIDMPSQTIWSTELETYADTLIATEPVIRRGDWIVGLFTIDNRHDVLATEGKGDLSNLSGIAPKNWVEDWRLLNSLELKSVVDAMTFATIHDMIANGRADFTLMSFSSAKDMGHDLKGHDHRLVPIPGVKAGIEASRHFAVSKANPRAKAIAEAIDRGLAQMREEGSVERIYRAAGFFDPRVDDWELVNEETLRNN